MDYANHVGKYEISNKVLGEGSFGTVYQGFSKEENLEVAIKHESCDIKDPQLEQELPCIKSFMKKNQKEKLFM